MRSDAREAAFKAVYANLLGGGLNAAARKSLYRAAKLNEEEEAFAERLLSVTLEKREELEKILSGVIIRYADYRVYIADRAILLLALAEIEYFDDIPPVVSVDEGVALARKYSTEKSADFVNGVLAGVINP